MNQEKLLNKYNSTKYNLLNKMTSIIIIITNFSSNKKHNKKHLKNYKVSISTRNMPLYCIIKIFSFIKYK